MIRTNRIRFITFFVVVLLALSVAGCPQDTAYSVASKSADDISTSINKAIPFVSKLYTTNGITREEKNGITNILIRLNDADGELIKDIRDLHGRGVNDVDSYVAAAQDFVDNADKFLADGALHVKNPQAQASLDEKFKIIRAGIDAITGAIRLAKGS